VTVPKASGPVNRPYAATDDRAAAARRPSQDIFRVQQSINIIKNAGLRPVIEYAGRQYSEQDWAAFALATVIVRTPELREDLKWSNARTIYELLVIKQNPAAEERAQVGDQVLLTTDRSQFK
jgi:hypothetical protein